MTRKEQITKIKKYINVLRNNEELSWGGVRTLKIIEDLVLALPIDVPSEEEIEEFIISHPDNTGNFILGAGISAGFKVGAKWAIEQTIKRNGKDKL